MTRKASSQSPRVVEFDGRVGGVGAFEDDLAGEDVDALEINGLIEPDGIEASGGDVALALIDEHDVVVHGSRVPCCRRKPA